ncbi:MAG TPA: hypothetical protein H9745_03740 [Candidatus Agathobaculum stercoravium]|nr:hypothetical protein [Candidatus Agathobaculum stercoravium]
MKKGLCPFVLLALLLLAACGEKSTIALDIQGAQTIELQSGMTGDSVTITDADTIAQITDNATSLRYRYIGDPDSSGWSYWIKWLDADGNVIGEMFPHGWHVVWNDSYYEVSGGTIDEDLLAELLGED